MACENALRHELDESRDGLLEQLARIEVHYFVDGDGAIAARRFLAARKAAAEGIL